MAGAEFDYKIGRWYAQLCVHARPRFLIVLKYRCGSNPLRLKIGANAITNVRSVLVMREKSLRERSCSQARLRFTRSGLTTSTVRTAVPAHSMRVANFARIDSSFGIFGTVFRYGCRLCCLGRSLGAVRFNRSHVLEHRFATFSKIIHLFLVLHKAFGLPTAHPSRTVGKFLVCESFFLTYPCRLPRPRGPHRFRKEARGQ